MMLRCFERTRIIVVIVLLWMQIEGSNSAITVVVTRQFSKLGDMSVLRCTIHKTLKHDYIKLVRWRKAPQQQVYTYFPKANKHLETGPKGRYRVRDIQGNFEKDENYHELYIMNTTLSDEGYFECEVRDLSFKQFKGSVHLNVVAPPETPPSIGYKNGTTIVELSDYDTNVISEMNIAGEFSYICAASASRPPPSVEWRTDSERCTFIHDVIVQKKTKYGVPLEGVMQRIDVCPSSATWLNCTVKVADPWNNTTLTRHMSLRITDGKEEAIKELFRDWGAILRSLILYFSSVVVLVLLIVFPEENTASVSQDALGWIRLCVKSSCIQWIIITCIQTTQADIIDASEIKNIEGHIDFIQYGLLGGILLLPMVHLISLVSVLLRRWPKVLCMNVHQTTSMEGSAWRKVAVGVLLGPIPQLCYYCRVPVDKSDQSSDGSESSALTATTGTNVSDSITSTESQTNSDSSWDSDTPKDKSVYHHRRRYFIALGMADCAFGLSFCGLSVKCMQTGGCSGAPTWLSMAFGLIYLFVYLLLVSKLQKFQQAKLQEQEDEINDKDGEIKTMGQEQQQQQKSSQILQDEVNDCRIEMQSNQEEQIKLQKVVSALKNEITKLNTTLCRDLKDIADKDDKIKQLENQLADLRDENKQLHDQLASWKGQVEDFQTSLEDQNEINQSKEREILDLKKNLKSKDTELHKEKEDIETKLKELEQILQTTQSDRARENQEFSTKQKEMEEQINIFVKKLAANENLTKEKEDILKATETRLTVETTQNVKLAALYGEKEKEFNSLKAQIEELKTPKIHVEQLGKGEKVEIDKLKWKLKSWDLEAGALEGEAEVIQNVMTEEMKEYIVETVRKHARTHVNMADIATAVKADCEQMYNGDWHMVMGRNFYWTVRRKEGHLIYYKINDHYMLLWRSV